MVAAGSSFPLDHYSADLTIKIPFKNGTTVQAFPHYGTLYNSTWIRQPQTEFTYLWDAETNSTDLKIHMNFTRNDFSFWTITFPILFIFFLLGTICFLGYEGNSLVTRIAITLGVFAFVFAFDAILFNVKPHDMMNSSTFADFMLKLVLVAAVAFTISSLIGYRVGTVTRGKKFNKKWHIIDSYHLYDVLAIVFVLTIIFEECAITNRYDLGYPQRALYPIIITIGLSWGLFSQMILGPHQRKTLKPSEPVVT
jgi:hypothetical protein